MMSLRAASAVFSLPPLIALLAVAAPVSRAAEFSVTPTLTTDYDFRGASFSAREPALQLALDLATESGFKGTIWGSNVDFDIDGLDSEVDVSLGWAGERDGINWDTGIVWYTYPSFNELNYPEVWIGASRGFGEKFTAGVKVWYSWDYNATEEEGYYLDGNASFALPAGFAVNLHVGYSKGDYWDTLIDDGYLDYSVGFSKSVDRLDFAVRYIDGSDLELNLPRNALSTDRKVVASVSTKLPWRD